ncbi:CPBP family intramembrane metalloprotease [Mucilaginibacter rubeus]|uniref:CPBP family intramembrane metalloprotease n=1 Tax=Mucilaginibacter rubeus TaxID=2027860 RepID=A0AAE6JLJ9_9SPHI|nr:MULTISPECIES: CPBP family intramembrane glutamic endopeptidase [Mucilaginibacter]QEM07901.1 CPBP family intramembrane metalloprotease [Mucilaginibacter rubeus]QEM20353.1 CPBP family intramembrane metalloprotease [Mucilaginibacter gossypii]QTE42927.1 CPBP family intramembrane metalloprotease [Mucilaginibacter rubeus]QTE49528.1 CPBP family intramembrane metalloprotease [Mucilaginibacter rubeus]QTE54624.1 CPBP family intramembrane metalloprotease [Mucilaginibacter rubeus]
MERKKLIDQLPAWLRVSVYFTVIIVAAYIAGAVPALDSIFFYFGIALLLSFLFLKAEGRPLTSLGFVPACATDWKNFFLGLLIGLSALLTSAGLTIWLNGGRLVFTGHADPVFLLILIFIHLWSSFAQEFTYRGYPFQRLLTSYGPWVAQLAVTLPFAIMHLKLNTGITWQQFFMTWLTTGMGSLLYGLCYLKTGKLILSIGLHFGWNLAQALVPRSPAECNTMLFTLIQDGQLYHPLYVLLPYLGITAIMMFFIWRSGLLQRAKETKNFTS